MAEENQAAPPVGLEPSLDVDAEKLSHVDRLSDTEQVAEKNTFQRPTGIRWFLVCLGLYLAAVLYGLDTTIAADVQGPVFESFGEISKLAWVGVGFPMGSVATILLIGVFYGRFEIKWLTLSSIAIFEIGSAICGAAPNMNALIVGRVIAGIGGAGMYLGALNYITISTSLRERPIYMALIGLTWGIGTILGPVVGGAFADSSATWRWAFYINLVLAGLTCPIYIILFPRWLPSPEISTRTKLANIDWVGAVLNAASFVLFMVTLTFAGSTWAWNSGRIIALWVILGVVLCSYFLQQYFAIFTTKENRIFPGQFILRRTLMLQYFATASAATALAVTVYYVPLFFQFTRDDSAIDAAVRLLPFITINITFTMLSGGLFPVVRYYSPFFFLGGIFMIIGGSLMFTTDSSTPVGHIYGFTILIAIGSGLCGQIGYTVGAAKVKPNEIPAAIGFINVAQIGSIGIALAIAGAIFQNVGYSDLAKALAGNNLSPGEIRAALAGADSGLLLHSSEQIRQTIIETVAGTISRLYGLVIAAGALALVSSIFMRHERLALDQVA